MGRRGPHGFGPEHRLRASREFTRVFAGECYAADDTLVVNGAPAEGGMARLGLSVSRKVGVAVVRNAWKRRIREVFRQCRDRLPPLDLVVRPRKGASLSYAAIERSLPRLAGQVARRLASGKANKAFPKRGRRP